jgi:hypothetical protein
MFESFIFVKLFQNRLKQEVQYNKFPLHYIFTRHPLLRTELINMPGSTAVHQMDVSVYRHDTMNIHTMWPIP